MNSMRDVFGNRLFDTARWWPEMLFMIVTLSIPAFAQDATRAEATRPSARLWYQSLTGLHAMPYVIGTAVFFYLFSVVLTMISIRSGYPPNVARFAVWLSLLLWLAIQVGVIFHFIVFVSFPIWFYIALFLFMATFGIILLTTKRQSA